MHETTRLLRDLVAHPSVNPMGRPLDGPELFEHQVTTYLDSFFRALAVQCERQTVAPRRDNVLAYFEATGAQRTLLFEAHQDTVPTDNMTIDPYCARIEDGRLYGRGACDVKGGMAAMLAAFARLVREKPRGAANVIFAGSVDEEHTGLGARQLMVGGLKADMAVVAEPTQLQIVNAHKGAVRWHLITRGRSCHSSRPEEGINAIYRMGPFLGALGEFAEQLRSLPPDPLLGPRTLSVGRIEGGTSVNTVPDFCSIDIDRRLLPGENRRDAVKQAAAFLKDKVNLPFEFSEPFSGGPALSPKGSEQLVERLGQAIDSVIGAHRVIAVPYGTDASSFAAGGIPSVVFGPGDIGRAHTKDEWVPLDEVEQASEILFRFACMDD